MTEEMVGFKTFLREKYKNEPTRQNLHHSTVRAVRNRLARGDSVKVIALDMEIGMNVVYNIKNGLTYRSVK